MNKVLIRTEAFQSETGNKTNVLEYYLTKDEHSFANKHINYICYGIEINIFEKNNMNFPESASSDNVFSSEEEARRIIDLLADGLATPCTLNDIISDILIGGLV